MADREFQFNPEVSVRESDMTTFEFNPEVSIREADLPEFHFNPRITIRDAAVPSTSGHFYVGVNREAKKVKEFYVGVPNRTSNGTRSSNSTGGGVAKKVIKGYVGDENGKARLFWGGKSSGNNLIVNVKTSIRNASDGALPVTVTTSIRNAGSGALNITVTTSIRNYTP